VAPACDRRRGNREGFLKAPTTLEPLACRAKQKRGAKIPCGLPDHCPSFRSSFDQNDHHRYEKTFKRGKKQRVSKRVPAPSNKTSSLRLLWTFDPLASSSCSASLTITCYRRAARIRLHQYRPQRRASPLRFHSRTSAGSNLGIERPGSSRTH
jgi:hypothetical protein